MEKDLNSKDDVRDCDLLIRFKSQAALEAFAGRLDGSVAAISVMDELKGPIASESWQLHYLNSDRIVLRRKAGGRVVESYRPMTRDEALVAITAVLTGFQPPRFLDRLDTPADQTQSEQSADCAALRGNSPDRRSQ